MIKKFIVNVTQRDIDKGKKLNCIECPVARAMRRIKLLLHLNVYLTSYRLYKNGNDSFENYLINLPKRVSNFILRFDKEKVVKPFKFQIEVEIGD